jgi:hypothetical protein
MKERVQCSLTGPDHIVEVVSKIFFGEHVDMKRDRI